MAYLKATLNEINVCIVYNVASFYQLKELCMACTTFVDMHASAVMKNEGFLSLTQQAITELLSRDSFFAPELEIYHGICRWMESNEVDPTTAKSLLQVVRLQLLPIEELLGEVRQSTLYEANDILDAITMINLKKQIELNQRGFLGKRRYYNITLFISLVVPEENVATPHRNAVVSDGQTVLLNGDTESYNGEQGYAVHTITRDHQKSIVIQLNQPYIINCIRMLLWDRDNRSYSYFVQVSQLLLS